jgi:hypothetical protein
LNPEDNTGHDLEKIDAILRVHFNIKPDELSVDEWAKLFQQWVYVQRIQFNSQQLALEETLTKVLYKLTSDVFKALNKKK